MTSLAVTYLDGPDPQQELKSSGCMDPYHPPRGSGREWEVGTVRRGRAGQEGMSNSKDLEAWGDLREYLI